MNALIESLLRAYENLAVETKANAENLYKFYADADLAELDVGQVKDQLVMMRKIFTIAQSLARSTSFLAQALLLALKEIAEEQGLSEAESAVRCPGSDRRV